MTGWHTEGGHPHGDGALRGPGGTGPAIRALFRGLRPQQEGLALSDLVAIAYKDVDTAQQVAGNLGQAVKAHEVELEDLVIVEHKDDGKIKLHQPSMAGMGAAGGALWGGLIGLIFFMPLFGMAIGAAAGAAGGAMTDRGVDDNFMKKLGEELTPGSAALIVLISKVSTDKILPKVQIPGTVIQTSLSNEDEQALKDALAKAAG
jgi:uncharacterized membrane protein